MWAIPQSSRTMVTWAASVFSRARSLAATAGEARAQASPMAAKATRRVFGMLCDPKTNPRTSQECEGPLHHRSGPSIVGPQSGTRPYARARPRRGPRKRRSRSRSPGYGFHYETLDHLLSVAEQGHAICVCSGPGANAGLGGSARRCGLWLLRQLLLERWSTA